MDDHGSTVLPEQSPNIDLIGDVADCTASLTSSDGRGVSLVRTNTGYELAYSSPGVAPSTAMLRGTITCDGDSVNIEHTVQVFERIPVPSLFEATVHPSQPTILSIPLESMGEGQQRYSVVVDGPLSRVASGETSIVLSGGDTYMLTVEPGGLLSENMLIFGTVHLMTQEGVEWTVEIELEATTQAAEWWMIWTEPGRVIGVMFLVLALSSLAGAMTTRGPTHHEDDQKAATGQPVPVTQETTEDAWGRVLDDASSADAFDVEKR